MSDKDEPPPTPMTNPFYSVEDLIGLKTAALNSLVRLLKADEAMLLVVSGRVEMLSYLMTTFGHDTMTAFPELFVDIDPDLDLVPVDRTAETRHLPSDISP